MNANPTITCPRCGERLPADFTRCDACGAFLSGAPAPAASPSPPPSKGARQGAPARAGSRAPSAGGGVSGTSWIFLIAGLLCGGAIGYTLHGAVGPRQEGGMPSPSMDAMGGAPSGMPPGQMPPEITKMIAEYREKLAANPNDVEANIGMGNLLFDSSQWQRAIEHYQRALDQTPRNPDVRVDMAVAYHNLGQNERAKQEMERVTRENPTHRNGWLNLGVVSLELGDRATAIRSWEEYLKLEPNGQHSASIRAQLEDMKRGS